MRKLTIVVALLATGLNVSAENIFNKLFKIKHHDYAKTNPGIDRMDVGDTGLFFYRLNRTNQVDKTNPSNNAPPEVVESDYDLVAIKEALAEQSKNTEPIKPVISKDPETESKSYQATRNEKRVIYGPDSSLQNKDVITAWDQYHEKKKELDALREEMERVRQARKLKEHAGKVDIEK